MDHVIGKDGLKPDPDKAKAVKDIPKPTCKKDTLSLLGFINYLAKFLPRLSEVEQPLRDLTLANTQFVWFKQHDKAFDKVKKLVANHPVLKYYDIHEEVTIQYNASEQGLGAILLQNVQPVNCLGLHENCLKLNRDMPKWKKNVWILCLVARSSHNTSQQERKSLLSHIINHFSLFSRNRFCMCHVVSKE